MAVSAQAVGAYVLVGFDEEQLRGGVAAGARDPALRVDDELDDLAREGREP
jgi:hypothetical protein